MTCRADLKQSWNVPAAAQLLGVRRGVAAARALRQTASPDGHRRARHACAAPCLHVAYASDHPSSGLLYLALLVRCLFVVGRGEPVDEALGFAKSRKSDLASSSRAQLIEGIGHYADSGRPIGTLLKIGNHD